MTLRSRSWQPKTSSRLTATRSCRRCRPVGFPDLSPQPAAAQRLEEAPHFGAPNDQPFVLTLASRAGPYDTRYEVWSDPTGAPLHAHGERNRPDAECAADRGVQRRRSRARSRVHRVGRHRHGLIMPGTAEDRKNGTNLVLINNEILAWRNMVDNLDGTFTFQGVYRAVLDTLPANHASGDRVWFFSSGVGLTDPNGYNTNVTVRAKLLMASSRGVLPIASATAMTTTTDVAQPAPDRTGQDQDQRLAPSGRSVTGPFTFTWAHRNRNDTSCAARTTTASHRKRPGVQHPFPQRDDQRAHRREERRVQRLGHGLACLHRQRTCADRGGTRWSCVARRAGVRVPARWHRHGHQRHRLTGNIYVLDGGKP